MLTAALLSTDGISLEHPEGHLERNYTNGHGATDTDNPTVRPQPKSNISRCFRTRPYYKLYIIVVSVERSRLLRFRPEKGHSGITDQLTM